MPRSFRDKSSDEEEEEDAIVYNITNDDLFEDKMSTKGSEKSFQGSKSSNVDDRNVEKDTGKSFQGNKSSNVDNKNVEKGSEKSIENSKPSNVKDRLSTNDSPKNGQGSKTSNVDLTNVKNDSVKNVQENKLANIGAKNVENNSNKSKKVVNNRKRRSRWTLNTSPPKITVSKLEETIMSELKTFEERTKSSGNRNHYSQRFFKQLLDRVSNMNKQMLLLRYLQFFSFSLYWQLKDNISMLTNISVINLGQWHTESINSKLSFQIILIFIREMASLGRFNHTNQMTALSLKTLFISLLL
jgi:hypothetical protein